MRRFLLFLAFACALLATVASGAFIRATHRGALNHRLSDEELYTSSSDTIVAQWLTQKIDHQDLASTETFLQKYYVNDQYFNPTTPRVFFMLGGEGPVSPAYVTGHFYINELASQYSAMIVALEHRFYGESIPGNDSSTKNLRFLSSDQALEDTVTFHQQIASQYNLAPAADWVIFGGSYSGSLSAWARLKYPHLFRGSFSASAPVEAQLDFSEYFEVVATSVGTTCSNLIAQANQAVNALTNTTDGLNKLVQMFNLCAVPQSPNDLITMIGDFSSPIAGVVQYNLDNNAYQPFDVPTMCEMMTSASTPLDGLANIWNANNKYNNQTECTDISYTTFIESMQPTSDGRSWTWQTCTEFGYFQTGEAHDQPFSSIISLQSFLQQCQDIFGLDGLTPNIDWINNFYGGRDIVTSHTVFTNGDVDPWHILGNYQQYSPKSKSDSILIHGTAHCADMYPPRSSDLPGLVSARQRQNQLLAQWLVNATETVTVTPTPINHAHRLNPKPALQKIANE